MRETRKYLRDVEHCYDDTDGTDRREKESLKDSMRQCCARLLE